MNQERKTINLAEIVGGGYKEFWNFKGRYCVCKGSRGSKKSKTTALWHIYHMMKYPQANALVVRKTERTLKDSAYSDLLWAANRLGVGHLWKGTVNPLELTYIPTGQKFLFRGFDDPLKITSISVPKGVLCWVWIEEAFEITKEEDFNLLDESIRGEVPDGLFKRFSITFNPWSDRHWLRKRFFDSPNDENKLAMTTTYLCNEWLDDSDRKLFDDMKIHNPKRWRVAAMGEWGISDGLIYDNWEEKEFDVMEISKRESVVSAFGLDFGYVNDPTALCCCLVDTVAKEIYIFDEMYKKAMTNEMIYNEIKRMGYSKEKIVADCAEPKSIDNLYSLGLKRIIRARKGRDSLLNGIDLVRSFKIFVHPKCVNTITELSNYTWAKDQFDNVINKPIDDFNHCLVAGTKITTLTGDKPIEDVTTSDYVLTRDGYKKVVWSGITDRNRTVYKVTTDTGHYLIGTDNHFVLTQDGFKRIDALRYGDKLLCQNQSNYMEGLGEDTQSQSEETTENTSNLDVNTCITSCGKSSTENVGKVITFTTLMEIAKTMTSRIWRKFLTRITPRSTNQKVSDSKECENISCQSTTELKNGTQVQQGLSGIDITHNPTTSGSLIIQSENATTAEKHSNQRQNEQDSVPTTANLHTEDNLVLTMLLENANFAEESSLRTNMQKGDFVVGCVLHVQKQYKADVVYDLTVAEKHEFFANGILVHNCMDAMRYALTNACRGSLIDFT